MNTFIPMTGGDKIHTRRCISVLSKVCGAVAPALFPPLHIAILYYFWKKYSRNVDRKFCTCSCWDTVFKGTYESGVASYKHMYFNATSNTLKMWIITVLCIIVLYECFRHLIVLVLEHQIRPSMLLLFLTSIFAHYYSWWSYVNYWNDEFYSQWNHQLFFTVTEIWSTILVVHLADCKTAVTVRKVLGITGIALLHVTAGGWDQFVKNVVHGEGSAHQVIRDVSFMVPDILHVILPLVLLRHKTHTKTELRTELFGLIALVLGGFLVSTLL